MKKIIKRIKDLFNDKKKRRIYLPLFILPFFIAIIIFGVIIFKDVKTLININGNSETNSKYIIGNKDYVLRDNATEYQMQIFTELKDMAEGKSEYDEKTFVELICKNYIADFYTWSNKFGQYDVGGLYYVYTPQREIIYIQARDGFYKYVNEYINYYKAENLLNVINVEANASLTDDYLLEVTGEQFKTYKVNCSWEYVPSDVFSSSSYQKRAYLLVVENNGRFEIMESYE